MLKLPIPSADPITHRVYATKCVAEIERLNAEEQKIAPLIQRVNDYLELQQGIIPSMAEVCQALNVPERTLRHQLQQLKTHYE